MATLCAELYNALELYAWETLSNCSATVKPVSVYKLAPLGPYFVGAEVK